MPLKLNSASGSITISAQDGTGNADITLPRSGIGSVSTLSDLGITATSAELNTLDGFNGDTSDLNTVNVTTLGSVEANKVVTAGGLGNVNFPDGAKAQFGTATDLQIYHDGSHSYVTDEGTGNMYVRSNGAGVVIANQANSPMAQFLNGNACELRFNHVTRFATTAVGADVTGEFIADSYNETYAAVTSSTNATTVNCEAGNAFSHTLTENTTFTFSNPPASGTAYTFSLELIQDASASGYTVTWPTVTWPSGTAPTLTATASGVDLFVFTTTDGGTTWRAMVAAQALA